MSNSTPNRTGHAEAAFRPLDIAVLTISDTRTVETDTAGQTLIERLGDAGHRLAERLVVRDDRYLIRAALSRWIADAGIHAVLVTGGTGLTGRDITPEAVRPLFDREIEGFGELFRHLSLRDIGTSTIQSRAFAGTANATAIFCLPGSPGACRLAWDEIIVHQLDARTRPCNLVGMMPRMNET